jgi:GT2 family glycosyltransferase
VIPVLGIPVIGRPDLLRAAIASIDEPVGRLVIIDNTPHGLGDAAETVCPPSVADLCVTRPPSNLGYAGSINHVIKTHPAAPWWCFTAADVVFGPGDLAQLALTMTGARWVGIGGDWRAFGLTAEAVDRVGLWDENFYPAYCEDADYEYRCTLAGVEWGFIAGTTTHAGSTTIQEARYAERNRATYPANRRYFAAKWGGELRGGEAFTTPFDRGGSVADWTLDLRRVRDQQW